MPDKPPQPLVKISTDLSLLLASIIAGAAIVAAIDSYFKVVPSLTTISWPPACQVLVVVLTTLRFFHGNAMWYSWELTGGTAPQAPTAMQQSVNRLAHYYLHICQYVLLLIAGKIVGDVETLIKLFLIISVVDVVWTGYNWIHETDGDLRRALGSWFLLNLVTGVVLIILLAVSRTPGCNAPCSYCLAAIYAIATIVDYIVNPKLFFGIQR